MKKFIIILAEEYWHTVETPKHKFIEASYLLNKIKDNTKYQIKILKTPKELLSTINSIGNTNIRAIFLFQDIFSDSYLNKKSISEMKNIMYDLKNNFKVNIYPGIEMTDTFASKRYYLDLINDMPYSALPGSKVFKIKYKRGMDKYIIKELFNLSKEMFETFNKIVIKKGYSYSAIQVRTFNKDLLDDKPKFFKRLEQLDFKYFFNEGTNAKFWENNITRYYILQGYNRIIKNRTNEYRVFFFGGSAKYIAWGDDIPTLCSSDYETSESKFDYSSDDTNVEEEYEALNKSDNIKKLNNFNPALGKEVLRFAKRVYHDYLKIFWKNDLIEHPIIFRVDVSYAVDPEFIDEHAIMVPGFENKIRLYVNELEIDPTNYFYNNLICKKDKEINNKYIQTLAGELINQYIENLH